MVHDMLLFVLTLEHIETRLRADLAKHDLAVVTPWKQWPGIDTPT
jgi:hypothetical protein